MTRRADRLCAACAAGFLAFAPFCAASPQAESEKGARAFQHPADVANAAGAQVLGSRSTVTTSATLYGGFQLTTSADVYILVRGNSLGTLGITQNYLDAPRVRLYDGQGLDLIFDNTGAAGFNFCLASGTGSTFSAPVRSYYALVRGEAAHDRDTCTSHSFAAGVYTFSVTPSSISVPTFGEVLFEVTLNP